MAALDIDGARACRHVAHAFGKDSLRQNGGCARSIADGFAGFDRGLTDHLRAEIFLRIFELEFFGSRDSVVTDQRRASFFLDQDAF